MSALPQGALISVDDYLRGEQLSEVRHEYAAGQVYALAGASDAHNTVSLNTATILRSHLRGGPCRVYMADMKVRLGTGRAFYYPDVLVTCDPADRENEYYKDRPKLVVEVLSPTTEGFDRGRKFAAYRAVPSLEEYVLIDPERNMVECYRRDGDQRWTLEAISQPTGVVRLSSVDLSCSLAQIYEDVVFPPDQ